MILPHPQSPYNRLIPYPPDISCLLSYSTDYESKKKVLDPPSVTWSRILLFIFWKEILRVLERNTQGFGKKYSGFWKEILRVLERNTQGFGKKYSGFWKEISTFQNLPISTWNKKRLYTAKH